MSEATIAAVATASGSAALSVVRISGSGALSCALKATRRTGMTARRPVLCRVLNEEGDMIDQGLMTWFPAPASFTGEDVVEFTGHGGGLVTDLVLRRFFESGSRPAEPGEFSLRAFLNGKIDLTQAEGIMDVIGATSETALLMAQQQMEGALGQEILGLRERISDLLVELEAYIDFPDENLDTASEASFLRKFAETEAQMVGLLETADRGRKWREGVRTVIAGAPNAGKSSLLNWLTGRDRAIVSATPGTTRDTLEELVVWEGLPLLLIDTAGLRGTEDEVEREGIRRTEREMARADVILHVVDGSGDPVAPIQTEAPVILTLNKADLGTGDGWTDGVAISCLERTGLSELMRAVSAAVGLDQTGRSGQRVAVNQRHRHLLTRALEALRAGREAFSQGLPPEITAFEVREALQAVGDIVGRVDAEDILGGIFARFCIGK